MPQYETEINSTYEFAEELKNNNPGLILVKFGATWCKPCKKVDTLIKERMLQMPDTFSCFIIDIDECLDVYAFLKAKRMVNGIPSILAWKKGNQGIIPDAVVASSNENEINIFFENCLEMVQKICNERL
jgi:thioredoxin-like negative regulator of GroEL